MTGREMGLPDIKGKKIRIREKRLVDARNDYAWQTDAELMRLDAARVLRVPFSVFLLDYVQNIQEMTEDRIQLGIDSLDGRHIGNCTCYNMDVSAAEAEIGLMIGNRDYWNKGYGTDCVRALVKYVFTRADFQRLYLKTLDWNQRAQKAFKKSGFSPCGETLHGGDTFILMEMHRWRWQETQGALRNFSKKLGITKTPEEPKPTP
ncbi:GNAT family N-acetyltransferase [Chloroflexota bacterium]